MGARFVFRLQPVLEQRERAEETEQVRVAALERERLAVEDHLRSLQNQLARNRDDLRLELSDPSRIGALAGVRLQANAALRFTMLAQRSAIELAGVMKRLETARADLIRATAARKAVQSLKDKQLAAHRAAELKKEAAFLDELAVMRHGRDGAMFAVESVVPGGPDQ